MAVHAYILFLDERGYHGRGPDNLIQSHSSSKHAADADGWRCAHANDSIGHVVWRDVSEVQGCWCVAVSDLVG